jgi:hypothetical protein
VEHLGQSPTNPQEVDERRRATPHHRRSKYRRSNLLLAVLGVALLVIAGVGFFVDKPQGLITGFLIVGGALVLVSVFAPRMEGQQKLQLTGFAFNLSKIAEAEIEIKAGQLTRLEEIK